MKIKPYPVTAIKRDLVAIGDAIVAQHVTGAYSVDNKGRAVFCVDGLTVRCKNNADSIAAVVAKYHRGLPRGGRSKQPRR